MKLRTVLAGIKDLVIIGLLIWLGLWSGVRAAVWFCVAKETNSHFPNPDRAEIWDSCEYTHAGFPRSFFPPPK